MLSVSGSTYGRVAEIEVGGDVKCNQIHNITSLEGLFSVGNKSLQIERRNVNTRTLEMSLVDTIE